MVKMKVCAVKDCSNNATVPNISSYCFPKCERRQIWIKFAGRGEGWTPKPGARKYSAHFSPNHITSRRRLHMDANPSINTIILSTILAGTLIHC
jgi:hypothetical protein